MTRTIAAGRWGLRRHDLGRALKPLIKTARSALSATYLDPEGRYRAEFAAPWRRAIAASIDWTLCYLAFLFVSIPLGVVEALGTVSWEEGDFGGSPGHVVVLAAQVLTVAPVVAYFGLLLPTSHTFGMRALSLHVVSTRTGRAPPYVVAFVRGVASTGVAVASYLTYMYATSFEKPRELDASSSRALTAAHIVFAVGAVSALAMIVTPKHRSILDRVFRTAVIDDPQALAPRMGPWGPLDAVDLSPRESSSAQAAHAHARST
jgi:uncharacterized RDD family membrane protein YckC